MQVNDLLEQLTMKIAGVKIENPIPVFPYTIEEHTAVIYMLQQQEERKYSEMDVISFADWVIAMKARIEHREQKTFTLAELFTKFNAIATPQPQISTIITQTVESKEKEK